MNILQSFSSRIFSSSSCICVSTLFQTLWRHHNLHCWPSIFHRLCPAKCTQYHQTSIHIVDEAKSFASTAEQNKHNLKYKWIVFKSEKKNQRQIGILVAAIVCTIYWNNVNWKRNLKFLLGNVCSAYVLWLMFLIFELEMFRFHAKFFFIHFEFHFWHRCALKE